jgi:hypothetical protein
MPRCESAGFPTLSIHLTNQSYRPVISTDGWFDKVAGPTRIKPLSLATLMAIAGALGYAVQFVEDPDTALRQRWTKRRHEPADNGRLSRLRRARAEAVAELASKAARARWAKATPQQRQAHIAMMNAMREFQRLARKSEAA